MARRKYPDNFYDAFKSLAAAKVLIISQHEELKVIKQSLVVAQDELGNWKNRYHESDKRVGILDSIIQSNLLAEIVKFLLSTVLAGIGINLLTDGSYLWGGIFALAAIVCYVGIVTLSRVRID